MIEPSQRQSDNRQRQTAPAELGQTDAKFERRSEKKLRQMGGDSDGGVQERHPPKLGQKKAKQEAEGDLAFRDLSGGNADQ